MEIVLLFALILLNGLFAMSEIALVTARKARMQALIDAGDSGAITAVELGAEPTRFLSTVQIGITSIGILNGIIGEGALAQPLAVWMARFGLEAKASGYIATAIVVIGITYFSIVLGELVPKRLGQLSPEAVARMVSRPLKLLALVTRPFVRLLAGSTDFVLKVLGVRERAAPEVEDEIHALMREGTESGEVARSEQEMVRNVFRLDDRQLGSLMVPRSEIVTLDASLPWEENVKRIEEEDHTRFPVLRGGWGDVAGVASARGLLRRLIRGETPNLEGAKLPPPVFVPESLTGLELLKNFRETGTQMAFVIDEYGEVLGMVTLRDVMEAITGEFTPRNVEESWAIKRDDGSWLLDGLIPIPELKDRLSLRNVPEEEKGGYHTLSGMMMLLLGKLPQTTDKADWDGWRFEVVDIDGKRVDKVMASPLEESGASDPEMGKRG